MAEEEVKHSKVGASGCHRWWECPGSVKLIEQCPEQETSFAAAEGTAAHGLAEWALCRIKEGKKADVYSRVGETVMEDDHEIEYTEEMADAVSEYLNVINLETKRLGTNYGFLKIEEKFKLPDVDKEARGTLDAYLYKPFDYIQLWDYKHGRGVVIEADHNKQLMYYALGAMQGKDIEKVITYVVQPRAFHPDGAIRKCEYSVDELLEFKEELKKRIAATKEPDAPVKTGQHCQFCPASVICPGVKEEANEIAKQDFQAVNQLDTETMIKLTEMAPRVISFLKEIETHLKVKAERGEEVPGFKLVKAKSNRVWKSESRTIAAFNRMFGDDMFEPRKLLSPVKFEKLAKGIIKEEEFMKYIDKPDNGLKLVKDSDPRKAVKSSAEEDFKAIL